MTRSKPIIKAAARAAQILPDGFKRLLYRLPFIAKTIRRTLNAAVPDGLSEVQIAAGPSRGLTMALDLHAEKDYWLGTYEPELRQAAEKLIAPGSVVYDVGANIGYVSLICASLSGITGHVYAFEALPGNIERLQQNIKVNGLSGRISVTHAAVIDQNQPVTFYTHRSGAMGKSAGSAGRDETYLDSITVDGIALDAFAFGSEKRIPDLIKMDIEGGEGLALRGAARLLAEEKPALLIELHGEEAARQVWEILTKNGYRIHLLTRGYPKVTNLDALDWKAYIAAIHPSHPSTLI